MDNPCSSLDKRLQLNLNDHILGKADDIYRRYLKKSTTKNRQLSNHQQLIPLFCIDLACDLNLENLPRKDHLVKTHGSTTKKYTELLSLFVKFIDFIKAPVTLEQLTTKYGLPNILNDAKRLLNKLENNGATQMDDCTVTALFFLVTKAYGAPISQPLLLSHANTVNEVFTNIIKDLDVTLKEDLKILSEKSGAQRRKSLRSNKKVSDEVEQPKNKKSRVEVDEEVEAEGEDNEDDKEEEEGLGRTQQFPIREERKISGINAMQSVYFDIYKTKEYKEYLQWKDQMLKFIDEKELQRQADSDESD
ncbi:hypothetical protein HK098_000578 [Nowakowskiella sp. JEL0407]|nr:hypothetical protein HK098_000578 [Nowakowskiella sp. JEL0407]